MKNKITLLRSYTSMLCMDMFTWAAYGTNWSKRRAVSNQIYRHLKTVYEK